MIDIPSSALALTDAGEKAWEESKDGDKSAGAICHVSKDTARTGIRFEV